MVDARRLREHLKRLRLLLQRSSHGALFVTGEPDLTYLCGVKVGRALVDGTRSILWVKDVFLELYEDLFESTAYPWEVRGYDKYDLKDELRALRAKTIGCTSSDAVAPLKKLSGKRTVLSEAVTDARAVKSRWEIENIKASCKIARAGMRCAKEVVAEGVRELDAVAEIQATMYRRGSEKPAFGAGLLLSSGKSSADIHANATLKRIRRGPCVVDLGAVYHGYYSDMSRTLAVGSLTHEQKRLMALVKNIQAEVVDMVRPGMLASSVHRFAAVEIEQAGYKLHHLIGHGVGLEIHEGPKFNPEKRIKLKPGMVFTVEPGLYLPRKFGVRFEDTVLLTKAGAKKIT